MDSGKKTARTTIFHQLLRPDAAEGYVVPTVDELKDEAYILLAAAADTTGNALTIAAYNIATNPEIYSRLTTELREAFPGPEPSMDFITLEKLPYLVSFCSRVRAMESIPVNKILDFDYQGSSTVSILFLFICIKKLLLTIQLVMRCSWPTSTCCARVWRRVQWLLCPLRSMFIWPSRSNTPSLTDICTDRR